MAKTSWILLLLVVGVTSAADDSSTVTRVNPCASETQRIYGGSEAKLGEFPWQASITWRGSHFCGGSLINQEWILTAAHCPSDPINSLHYATLGEYRRLNFDGSEQLHKLLESYRHPLYGASSANDGGLTRNDHDIALIRLQYPAVLNEYVQPINLPEPWDDFSGSCCTVIGWGQAQDGRLSQTLKKLDLPAVSARECAKGHSPGRIKDFHICGGAWGVAGQSPCGGDSGGSLVCRRDGKNYLAGLVSWGGDCGAADSYTVFMNVARYRRWIDQVIAKYT